MANVSVLVVAGGGGGGNNGAGAGGGGAGGYVYEASQAVANQAYAVTVGDGGQPGNVTLLVQVLLKNSPQPQYAQCST